MAATCFSTIPGSGSQFIVATAGSLLAMRQSGQEITRAKDLCASKSSDKIIKQTTQKWLRRQPHNS